MHVLVHTYNASRGKLCSVKVTSLEDLINNDCRVVINRRTHIAEIGGSFSIPLCELSVDDFETLFNVNIITMKKSGVLNYYPNGRRLIYGDGTFSKYISQEVKDKYPIFSAKVYNKYGVPCKPEAQDYS